MSTRAERANEAEVEAADAGRGPETAEGLLGSPSLADVRLLRASASEPALRPLVARQVGGLQRVLGNRHVLRLLHGEGGWNAEQAEPRSETASSRPALPVQRYAVGVAADASCEEVFNWLQSSSPHAPGWAKTTATFGWTRSMTATEGEEEGTYTVTVADPTVTLAKVVDMPEYAPATRGMQAAWSAMYSELRTHEGEHETIADEWQTTLSDSLGAAEYTVTAGSAGEAKRQGLALADGDWTGWIAEHQAAQNAIDPFFATLTCPAEDEDEDEQETIGEEAVPFEA